MNAEGNPLENLSASPTSTQRRDFYLYGPNPPAQPSRVLDKVLLTSPNTTPTNAPPPSTHADHSPSSDGPHQPLFTFAPFPFLRPKAGSNKSRTISVTLPGVSSSSHIRGSASYSGNESSPNPNPFGVVEVITPPEEDMLTTITRYFTKVGIAGGGSHHRSSGSSGNNKSGGRQSVTVETSSATGSYSPHHSYFSAGVTGAVRIGGWSSDNGVFSSPPTQHVSEAMLAMRDTLLRMNAKPGRVTSPLSTTPSQSNTTQSKEPSQQVENANAQSTNDSSSQNANDKSAKRNDSTAAANTPKLAEDTTQSLARSVFHGSRPPHLSPPYRLKIGGLIKGTDAQVVADVILNVCGVVATGVEMFNPPHPMCSLFVKHWEEAKVIHKMLDGKAWMLGLGGAAVGATTADRQLKTPETRRGSCVEAGEEEENEHVILHGIQPQSDGETQTLKPIQNPFRNFPMQPAGLLVALNASAAAALQNCLTQEIPDWYTSYLVLHEEDKQRRNVHNQQQRSAATHKRFPPAMALPRHPLTVQLYEHNVEKPSTTSTLQ